MESKKLEARFRSVKEVIFFLKRYPVILGEWFLLHVLVTGSFFFYLFFSPQDKQVASVLGYLTYAGLAFFFEVRQFRLIKQNLELERKLQEFEE